MKARLWTDGGARGNPGPAAYGYVLETGRIILHDKSSALRANERVKSAYLGA